MLEISWNHIIFIRFVKSTFVSVKFFISCIWHQRGLILAQNASRKRETNFATGEIYFSFNLLLTDEYVVCTVNLKNFPGFLGNFTSSDAYTRLNTPENKNIQTCNLSTFQTISALSLPWKKDHASLVGMKRVSPLWEKINFQRNPIRHLRGVNCMKISSQEQQIEAIPSWVIRSHSSTAQKGNAHCLPSHMR